VLRRFDFGAKAFNIGGIRLGLVFKADRPPRAEKYGDPQLIAEIKTALEKKLRELLGDEYEQWRDHIKTTEGGRRLTNNSSTAQKTHAKPQHRQTKRKNLKTHKNKKAPPRAVAPTLLSRRSWVHGESRPTNPTGPATDLPMLD
jgi:hypothetical protein